MKRWLPLSAVVLLGGCAGMSPAPVPAAWTQWVCDSQAKVQWRFTDNGKSLVDARLDGSAQVYHLKPEPGSDGQLYSDGVLALHVQGTEGLIYWVATNDLIGRGCKTP